MAWHLNDVVLKRFGISLNTFSSLSFSHPSFPLSSPTIAPTLERESRRERFVRQITPRSDSQFPWIFILKLCAAQPSIVIVPAKFPLFYMYYLRTRCWFRIIRQIIFYIFHFFFICEFRLDRNSSDRKFAEKGQITAKKVRFQSLSSISSSFRFNFVLNSWIWIYWWCFP